MTDDDEQLSDHDLLRKIYQKVKKLERCMTNHLHRHFLVTLVALTALFSLVVGLVLFGLTVGWGG